MIINEITEAIIGSSIEVHRELGPGLLESRIGNVCATNSSFEDCLSSVSGRCRWFTKVSDWIVAIAWT